MPSEFERLIHEPEIYFDQWPFRKQLRYLFSISGYKRGLWLFWKSVLLFLERSPTRADAVVKLWCILLLCVLAWDCYSSGAKEYTHVVFWPLYRDVWRQQDFSC